MANTKATVKKPQGKTYTEAEVKKLLTEKEKEKDKEIDEKIAEAVKNALANAPVQVHKDEYVSLLYMGEAAKGVCHLNNALGDIGVRGGTRDIPKRDFLQNLTDEVMNRLKDRRLIILSGFTDEERQRYGVEYTDGELLSANVYYKLFDMSESEVLGIFDKACFSHKKIISTMYIDAYINGDNRINEDIVKKLNEISKKTDPDGMFTAILKDMGRQMG